MITLLNKLLVSSLSLTKCDETGETKGRGNEEGIIIMKSQKLVAATFGFYTILG